ncbi:MAG: hypothetical protein ACLFUX_01390 [Spirochaetaceae bacterium]
MRRIIFVGLLGMMALAGTAQDGSDLDTYLDSFESGSDDVKVEVLRRAAEEDVAREVADAGVFYVEAAQYVRDNAEQIAGSSPLREMVELVAEGTRHAEATEALEQLWHVFEAYDETAARVELLSTFGALGAENDATVSLLRDWLEEQNRREQAGERPDREVVGAGIDAMAAISDPSFFESLFEAALTGYPSGIRKRARQAMYDLEGDIVELAARSIGNRSAEGKLAAVEFLMTEDELNDEEKAAIAAAAIRDALSTEAPRREQADTLREVRFLAAEVISETGYAEAEDALISHFNRTFLEYDRGLVTRSRVLDVIDALGTVGTEAAAERLSRFLELLNRYTENDRPYDTRIVMETINTLAEIGHPVAYNPLFYTTILDAYPSRVQNAASEALASLDR